MGEEGGGRRGEGWGGEWEGVEGEEGRRKAGREGKERPNLRRGKQHMPRTYAFP